MSGYLLDTHVWLWAQSGDTEKIGSDLQSELEKHQHRRQLCVSAISILEIARLVALKQYTIASSIDDFIAEATADDGLVLLDLSPRILIESTRLPDEIHRDPSDRILIATAREHNLTLITRDKDILRYAKQGHLNARKP
jgi:PIN domain nuclease of toxin-antitoxin system